MSSGFCLLLNSALVMLVITSNSSPFTEPTYIIILLHEVEN